MTITAGKRYFGAHDAARLVMTVGDDVHYVALSSMRDGRCSVAEFEAWASDSSRRNYTHTNGERRIKIETTEPREATEDTPAREAGVLWVDVDTQSLPQWSNEADWAAWRAGAE